MPGLDWFEAGEAVFRTDTTDPRFFPPLDDAHAQRIWLGGFGAAWADWGAKCPGARPTEALWDAIYRRLGDRRELIDCLQRVNRCGWYEAQ
ncbi:MAG: hypothetical protein K9M02_16960 [Thiohalocapsa sp.]|nr:hypothetical protein [Thiohalocapsa sp.]